MDKNSVKQRKLSIGCAAVIAAAFIGLVLIILIFSGTFDLFSSKYISDYTSDTGFKLTFSQLGSPQWPFGSTEVRLEVEDKNGKRLVKYDTFIQDDGASASEHNVQSVEWLTDGVRVVLQASEMPDKEIMLPFKGEPNENLLIEN